jgi:hypothetical protein
MGRDIFEFWSNVPGDANVHPADDSIFKRHGERHNFNLNCLPTPFIGPLLKAPIVLLYKSPGLNPLDVEEATTEAGHTRYAEMRRGHQPLPGPEDHKPTWRWWRERTAWLREVWEGDPEDIRSNVAVLDIAAYHSPKNFKDYHLLAALPSCRVSLDWAHNTLFPQAEEGKRLVVVLRSHGYWGLQNDKQYGETLFAARPTRSGYMCRGGLREKVVKAAQRVCRSMVRRRQMS